MKKIIKHFYLSCFITTGLLGISCSEEVINNENLRANELGTLNHVTASIPDFREHGAHTTRTAVEGDQVMSLVWAEKDTIGIFPSSGFQVPFSMAEGAGQKNAIFTGGGWGLKKSSSYSAYYPMIGQFYLDKTAIPMSLNGQKQKSNGSSAHIGAYDYLVAINSAVDNGRVNFDFQHLVTILRLKITMPRAGTYTTVLLKTDGQLVTEGTINLNDGTVTPTKLSNQQVLNLDDICLTEANLVLDTYIAIAPVDLSSNVFTVEVFDNKGNCYSVNLVGLDFIAGDFYRYNRTETKTILPMLTISTEDGMAITSKDVYKNASLSIAELEETPFNVKGRGNSTWTALKKPYAIKFDNKTSIMSLPADKSWVLLANYYDPTLLRNDLALYMGNEMSNLDWTPHFYPVELTLNGEYKGLYQVGEKIKISKKRVNVGDDGFLLEIDAKAESDEITFTTPHLSQPVNIKDPEVVVNDENYNYVKDYVRTAEAALYSENFKDPEEGWQKYLDMDSFVDWYIINEISKNVDACRFLTSCYMNLKRGGKIKMGPLWDFDLAFGIGNGLSGSEWAMETEGFALKERASWYIQLFNDPEFVNKVKDRFDYYYKNKDKICERIDYSAALIKDKVFEDNKLWGKVCSTSKTIEEVKIAYQAKVDELKDWIVDRLEWLNININNLGSE